MTPYYAVKSNPEPYLLKTLGHYGFGFDCASAREIAEVRNLKENYPIIYANPCKSTSDIVNAGDNSIKTTVVDSHEEVDKLVETSWKGDSLIRIRVEDSDSIVPFSKKFGVSLKELESLASYSKMKGQCISGISFHVGSGSGNSEQFSKAIRDSCVGFNILKKYDHSPKIMDIGGGFTNNTFGMDSKYINMARGFISTQISMIAEPGRFISETSHDLFVRVIGKKAMTNGKAGYRYTIDESLYGQFSCIPFDCAKPMWLRIREDGEELRNSIPGILYGRTCDGVDMIAASPYMEELMEGDWLWFPNMGAYTSVTSSEFNGFPKPPVYILEDNMPFQLPSTNSFQAKDWPQRVQYVCPVKTPILD